MWTRISFALTLFFALRAWSQVDTTLLPLDQPRMLIPPPVSGTNYPTEIGSEARFNYLRAGVTFSLAHNDNVVAEAAAGPVSDILYSVWPTIQIDKRTERLHWTLDYDPGFTLYQKTSALNQSNQDLTLDFRYRLSPHTTISLRDSLQKTSNVFNQPDPLGGGAVSGGAQGPVISVIAPTADQLSNVASVGVTDQFSRSGMVGGDASFTDVYYLDPAQSPGLYDSSSRGGSGFYSHRLSLRQYVGGTYTYSQISAYPKNAQSETRTNTPYLFYTLYMRPTLSVSVSGGPQYFSVAQKPLKSTSGWSPAGTVSMGYQGSRTTLAASYLRSVSGGGGLVGAFHSNSAMTSERWQLTRTWNAGVAGAYAINKNVTPYLPLASPGGHSISGTVSFQHSFSDRIRADFGYTHVRQSYPGIPLISGAPNTNREFVSITYQFSKPL
jgi:hypothetical protein